MTVAVVTDSTSALPDSLRSAPGLTVLGIPVFIGGREFVERSEADGRPSVERSAADGEPSVERSAADGEPSVERSAADGKPSRVGEVGSDEVVKALRDGGQVTTSRLAPELLRETYNRLLDEGASGIVSVHLSGKLSGTVAAAEAAAAGFGGRVAVVDSLGAGMGIGYPALAALDAAAKGADQLACAAAAQETIARTTTYFYLDTLEHLRRGGRISAAKAFVGTALSVKPILGVDDGRIDMIEKVRTPTRGLQRLAALAVSDAGEAPVEMTVHHLGAERRAEALAGWLRERFGERLRRMDVVEVGAAIGAHCGPGLVGVVTRRLA